ncbi:MAG: hypothetical protein U0Y82_12170 [Thermoleophilia bacterium]
MQMRDVALTEALVACQQHRVRTEAESVPVAHCAGRALAEGLQARMAGLPMSDTASMDGFAVRAGGRWLRVVGSTAPDSPDGCSWARRRRRVSTGDARRCGLQVAAVSTPPCTSDFGGYPARWSRAYVRRAGEVIMEGVLMLPCPGWC